MTSLAGNILFLVSAVFAFVGAMVTVAAKRPLRAAVGLLVNIVALAGLYLTLSAELLAALQLLVYAGAVVVLFVFVIMLIGPEAEVQRTSHVLMSRLFSLTFMAMVGFSLAYVAGDFEGVPGALPPGFGTVEGIGNALFLNAAVPFELVSITLLVAVIGAVAVARGRTPREAEELRQHNAARGIPAVATERNQPSAQSGS
jgi:NADH-quinone oxidoreductase subunit J